MIQRNDTLYEKMGGDIGIQSFMESLYDETLQDKEMKVFFRHSSVSVLVSHQIKLYRLLFGPEENRPKPEDVVNYMLMSHTRIFRDMGLNETHFDKIAKCFVEGLQALHTDQDIIDECLVLLGPLRDVFAYGAKVASKEKKMGGDELASLPKATADTMSSNVAVVLPDPVTISEPVWLKQSLKIYSNQPVVRAWTAALTTEFGEDGDTVVADTFLAMPYMHHHVYLVALLQLAFLPVGEPSHHLIKMIKYPRGETNDPVCLSLWNRMVTGFLKIAGKNGLRGGEFIRAETRLQGYNANFPTNSLAKVGGVKVPHVLSGEISYFEVLSAKEEDAAAEEQTSVFPRAARKVSLGTVGTSTSEPSTKSPPSTKKRSKGKFWRRLFRSG